MIEPPEPSEGRALTWWEQVAICVLAFFAALAWLGIAVVFWQLWNIF